MKTKKIAITILFSALAMGTSYLINFFLTPYITENIGAEAYGFVSLSKNFVMYAGIITIALNSYATRFITVAYHQGNKKKCNKYFSTVFYANIVLAIILFVAFSIGAINISSILNVSVELVKQVEMLFFLTGTSFSITTAFTVFSASAYIKNKLDKVNIFKGVSYLVEAIVLIMLFRCFNAKVWFVAIGSVVSAIIVGISNFIIYKYYTPDIVISKKNVSISIVKELVSNGVWNSLNSLGNMLNSGLDLIITNLMLTPLAMGQLAIAKTISSMFYSLLQLLAQPFQPIFLKDYSEEKKEILLKDLKTSMVVSGFFSNLAFAGFVGVGLEYFQLWIPSQDTELVWSLTVITLLGSVIEGAIYPLYYIYTLTIRNKVPCIITIIGGIINVVGMYILLKYTNMGVYAVVLTTTIIMSIISFVTNPIYMSKCLNISVKSFYPQLLRHILSCILMVIAFTIIGNISLKLSWITFIFKVFLCCIVGTIIHIGISGENLKVLLSKIFKKENIKNNI